MLKGECFMVRVIDYITRFAQKNYYFFVLFFPVVDTNDRFLRKITVGQASSEKGQIREVWHYSGIKVEKHSIYLTNHFGKLEN